MCNDLGETFFTFFLYRVEQFAEVPH